MVRLQVTSQDTHQGGKPLKRSIFTVAAVFLLLGTLSTTAMAQEGPIIAECNPDTDPYNCQCSEELAKYGSCTEIPVDTLISPDDPAELREAAEIQTEYNSEKEVYEITINAAGVNGGGVLPLNSNHGEWDSFDELTEYLSVLLGLPVLEDGSLPPYQIEQHGRIARYDQFNEQWAVSSPGQLVYSAITDGSGSIFIPGVIDEADVVDDEDCGSASSGPLYMHQCSVVDVKRLDIMRGPNEPVQTIYKGPIHTEVDQICDEGLCNAFEVNLDVFPPVIRVTEVEADRILVKNNHFRNYSFEFNTSDDDQYVPSLLVGYEYPGTAGPVTNGICGFGRSDLGIERASVPQTRAGLFDAGYDICN